MSILKTNSAVGAYKSAAEWITKHFDVDIDLEKAESFIEMKDGKYDVYRTVADKWDFKWNLEKLIFEGDQPIQIPTCFSQSFLDRIQTIKLEDHSKFDPDQIKDFPILRNLSRIKCEVSAKDDIFSFIDKMCHLAKRIAPENNRIVSVTICDDDLMQFTRSIVEADRVFSRDQEIIYRDQEIINYVYDRMKYKKYESEELSGELYDFRVDGKNLRIEARPDVRASIVQCNNTIIKYLYGINIENLSELEVCADYFVTGAMSERIVNNASLKKLAIRPLCMKSLEKKYLKENYLISITNCHLYLLDIPDDFPIEITNSNISGLKGLLDRCSRICVDDRSRIKSGLGVVPISSHAIDMFGNFIHANDVVAVPVGSEIRWYKVIGTGREKVSVIAALLPEDQRSDDFNYKYINYYSHYIQGMPSWEYTGTRIEKIEIGGRIREACVADISDKSCWKIDVSFLEKSDVNKFHDESIQLLKHDVSFALEDPSDDQCDLVSETDIDKINEHLRHFMP